MLGKGLRPIAAALAVAASAGSAWAQGSGVETVYYVQGGSSGPGYASASVDFQWRVIACFGEIHVAYGLVSGSLTHSDQYWMEGENAPVAVEARIDSVGTMSIEISANRGPAYQFDTVRDGIAGQTLGFDCFSGQTRKIGMVSDHLTNPTPEQTQQFLATIDVNIRGVAPLRSQTAESEIRRKRADEEREREQAEDAEAERLAELDRMRELRAQAEETAAAAEDAAREAEEQAAREARAGGDGQLLSELERLDQMRERAGSSGDGGGEPAGADDPSGIITVDAPADGASVDTNVVWVEGRVDLAGLPAGEPAELALAVNGQSQLVSVDGGGAFRSAAVLGAGENELLLTLSAATGQIAQASRRVTLSGVGGGLRVTLTWDNYADIDLYVTSPSGAEVYYSNDSIDGMTLDVDNTSAYGPENVTVPEAAGTYSFAANNYSGTGGVTARIDVFVNEVLQNSYSYTFGGGERWEAGSVTVGGAAAAAYSEPVTGAIIMSD